MVSDVFEIFTPKIGEDEPILTHIFQNGLKPPPRLLLEELGTCFVCLIFLSQEQQSEEGEIESGSSQER